MLNLQSIYFGQKHPNFDYKDYDLIRKISKLAHKHHKQAENDCNGEGWVKNKFYRCDGSVKGAYLADNETTIFSAEMDTIEDKITKLLMGAKDKPGYCYGKFTVEFQYDPRGHTVKLYYEGDFIEL